MPIFNFLVTGYQNKKTHELGLQANSQPSLNMLSTYRLLLRLEVCLSLELVVGHGDDGEDQVDQVERPQKDVQDEEGDVHGAGGPEGYLKKSLPLSVQEAWFMRETIPFYTLNN